MEKLPISLSGRRPNDHSARAKEIVPFHPRHRFRQRAGNSTDMKKKLVRCPVTWSSVSASTPADSGRTVRPHGEESGGSIAQNGSSNETIGEDGPQSTRSANT